MARSGLRWRIAILLLVVTMINFLDRQALAVAAPVLQTEFAFTKADYGFITSAFLLTYAVGQALSGRVLDTIGTRRGFAWAVALWSVAGILHVFGRGFWSFLGLRALLGLFEGFNFPAAIKAVAEWFPKQERALGTSIVRVGTGLGALLSPPLLGFLIYFQGWQAAFLAPGLVGFLWLFVWRRMYHAPEAHPRLDDEERALILADRVADRTPGEPIGWRELLARREIKGMMAARFFADNLLYFYLFWLPIYLSDERGFSLVEIGLFAWIPFLCSDIGGLFVGWLSGYLLKRGWTLDQARKRLLWASGFLVPVASLAGVVESAALALALISFGLFANQLKTTPLFTLPADLFPPRAVGTAWGMCGAAGSLGAMLFQPGIGWIADRFSYVPVFVFVSLLPLLAAIIISLTVRRIEPAMAPAARRAD